MDYWYDMPMVVRYRRPTDEKELIGIAYREVVIDLETGIVWPIKEILKNWAGDIDDAIIEWCEWKPLSLIK